jgi:hypothetical protein
MNTDAKVGVFVFASVLVLASSIYYVRTTQTVRGQVPYKTYLRYAGGLAPGASVLGSAARRRGSDANRDCF